MLELKRILLIAPGEMTLSPAFERARALSCATGALLHIVAFDYVQALAISGLLDHDAVAQAAGRLPASTPSLARSAGPISKSFAPRDQCQKSPTDENSCRAV